jgi:luciferase family oxidoreductase group 1
MVPLSLLDLSPIVEGGTAAQALARSLDLARLAEKCGYRRYWVAEHHNMPGIASAATAVVIGHIAAGTSTIRVGSGGVMLPNHAPLTIAEQFGTLESLFPGRIDLGLGRAPGTDQLTARALRRGQVETADTFPRDVMELQAFFQPATVGQPLRAVPGAGLSVPIWLLGSSLFSAQLAAALGLPFAFASHFAPDLLGQALEVYRGEFRPSASLKKPYAMAAIAVYASETDAQAQRLFTSLQQSFVNLRRGTPSQLPRPVDSMEGHWTDFEKIGVTQAFREAVVGSPETVRRGISDFVRRTSVDELMVTAAIFEHEARLRSFEIIAQACKGI